MDDPSIGKYSTRAETVGICAVCYSFRLSQAISQKNQLTRTLYFNLIRDRIYKNGCKHEKQQTMLGVAKLKASCHGHGPIDRTVA
jgi:hypothetical protein